MIFLCNYKNLIKTSQFAKLCNVTKQTLIYYNKIGLFNPIYVNKKGYRFYSIVQYDEFMLISILRDIDTPLNEIKQYLENKNISSFLELLNQKQTVVNKKIDNYKQILNIIEEKKNIIQNSININNTANINIEYLPEEEILISKPLNIKEIKKEEYIKEIINFNKCKNKINLDSYYVGAIVSKNKLLAGKDYNITYFYTKLNKDFKKTLNKDVKDLKKIIIKPKGFYLTTFHKGDYKSTYLTYKHLKEYVKLNNYIIVGDSYEGLFLDFCCVKNENEYLTKISIHVEKN